MHEVSPLCENTAELFGLAVLRSGSRQNGAGIASRVVKQDTATSLENGMNIRNQ